MGTAAAVRFWLEDHTGLIGMAGSLAIVVGVVVFMRSYGPVEQVSGQVVGPAIVGGGRNISRGLYVLVNGRRIQIRASDATDCRSGDRVDLERWRVIWGYHYRMADTPRPCQAVP